MSGHIYFLKISENLFKVGKSTDILSRLRDYKPMNPTIEMVFRVDNVDSTEVEILGIFRDKFIQRKDRGDEYFSGDCEEMRKTLLNYISELKVSDSRVESKNLLSYIVDDKYIDKLIKSTVSLNREYEKRDISYSVNGWSFRISFLDSLIEDWNLHVYYNIVDIIMNWEKTLAKFKTLKSKIKTPNSQFIILYSVAENYVKDIFEKEGFKMVKIDEILEKEVIESFNYKDSETSIEDAKNIMSNFAVKKESESEKKNREFQEFVNTLTGEENIDDSFKRYNSLYPLGYNNGWFLKKLKSIDTEKTRRIIENSKPKPKVSKDPKPKEPKVSEEPKPKYRRNALMF